MRRRARGRAAEPADKPHFVAGGHLSGTGVAAGLVRPTWDLASSLRASLLGLAPGRGWPFHARRVLVLVPRGVSQAPGIVTVPLFLPFVGRAQRWTTGVTRCRARWSADFPPRREGRGDRLAGPAAPAAGAQYTLTMGKSEREVGCPSLGSMYLVFSATVGRPEGQPVPVDPQPRIVGQVDCPTDSLERR